MQYDHRTMDECLPLDSSNPTTLRMLLEKERDHRADLEQEVARLRAAIARQNEIVDDLMRQSRERTEELQRLRTLVAGLQDQNTTVRTQAAQLHQELGRLRGMPLAPAPRATPPPTPAAPEREPKVRTKRKPEQNAGRKKTERANRWMNHAAETCPRCGEQLSDGWIHRRVQVIDLPLVAPLEVTEHRIIRRQCPSCKLRVLPRPPGAEAERVGRCRFGPRLMAAMTTMATVERLTGRMIQSRLEREYGLVISHGTIVELLHRMARASTPTYEQLQQDVRGSPVVYADETGWRQNGKPTTVWTVSTQETIYVHHGRRTNEEIDGILTADFAGTIVSDCYAAYDHFEGTKQRCWAHLLRDLDALLHDHGEDRETVAWVEGIIDLFRTARQPRPAHEQGWGYGAVRARAARAARYEAMLLLLCPAQGETEVPYATLCARLRKHVHELFTFVRDPRVEPTNNNAERSLRSLVIARKVSGGTRSSVGSTTRMVLYSVAATAKAQGKNPTDVFHQIILAPPGAPSALALTTATD